MLCKQCGQDLEPTIQIGSVGKLAHHCRACGAEIGPITGQPVIAMPSLLSAAIDGDQRMRKALADLQGMGWPATWGEDEATTAARGLAALFESAALLLASDPQLVSPDARGEARALIGRVTRAVFAEREQDRRRRTYLENRIRRQAGRCEGKTSRAAIEAAGQRVVELTNDDVHTRPLAPKLAKRGVELLACIRACVALRPGRDGKLRPPGTRTDGDRGKTPREHYDDTFDALCRAIGVATAEPATRDSALSRIRHKSRS